jgi:hypothetical protein
MFWELFRRWYPARVWAVVVRLFVWSGCHELLISHFLGGTEEIASWVSCSNSVELHLHIDGKSTPRDATGITWQVRMGPCGCNIPLLSAMVVDGLAGWWRPFALPLVVQGGDCNTLTSW